MTASAVVSAPKELQLLTLGQFQISYGGTALAGLASRKAEALLVYLAVTGQRHSREALAALLWDDLASERARGNLSVVLTSLRQQVGSLLISDRRSVGLAGDSIDCDVVLLRRALQQAQQPGLALSGDRIEMLAQALRSYRGDFLQGFSLRDGAEFDAWMRDEQEHLRHEVVAGYELLIDSYQRQGNLVEAIGHTQRIVQLDPWHEPAHGWLMTLLDRAGQRAAALAHYAAYRRQLQEELGVVPSTELQTINEAIWRSAAEGRRPETGDRSTASNLRGMPQFATSFLGRQRELEHISRMLADQNCRLLTLLGPGGSGKTRLAAAAATAAAAHLAQGSVFVALARGQRRPSSQARIADALGLRFSGSAAPLDQLIEALREQELLLVLDNWEHLLAGADLVSKLLDSTARVRVLTTSRARLGLAAEHLLDIDGLERPAGMKTAATSLEEYSAIKLFVQRARAIHPDFRLAPVVGDVATICELVAGMPLAIELAAAWVRTFSPAQIVAELGRNADILTSQLADVPSRHRSMRAVFDHSWRLLNADEQLVLRRVSVFRGRFDHDAARAVLGTAGPESAYALLATLSGLVDKSLLRSSAGRFALHELVRQYAAEQLQVDQQELALVCASHATYYADWLVECEYALRGAKRREALDAIGEELDNLRAGWDQLLLQGDARGLERLLHGLSAYYDARGLLQEAEARFTQAHKDLVAQGCDDRRLLALLQLRQGFFADRMGEYQRAETLLDTALSVLQELGDQASVAFALSTRGRVAEHKGAMEQAIALHNDSLILYQALGDRSGEASALHNLGSAYEGLHQYAAAAEYAERSLALRRTIGDLRGTAFSLNLLGIVREMQSDFALATGHYLESMTLFAAIGDTWAILLPLCNLGDVASSKGDWAAAGRYYREAMTIARDHWLLPQIMMMLVKIAQLRTRTGGGRRQLYGSPCRSIITLPTTPSVRRRAFCSPSLQLPCIRAALDGIAAWHCYRTRCYNRAGDAGGVRSKRVSDHTLEHHHDSYRVLGRALAGGGARFAAGCDGLSGGTCHCRGARVGALYSAAGRYLTDAGPERDTVRQPRESAALSTCAGAFGTGLLCGAPRSGAASIWLDCAADLWLGRPAARSVDQRGVELRPAAVRPLRLPAVSRQSARTSTADLGLAGNDRRDRVERWLAYYAGIGMRCCRLDRLAGGEQLCGAAYRTGARCRRAAFARDNAERHARLEQRGGARARAAAGQMRMQNAKALLGL
ncbi:tetratricopeptide repeat protein [Candidatus Gracilibacteria bacterium]|nr:tetratricopeptide repeat protein [Candidatus Gracilibacteria bacterium]